MKNKLDFDKFCKEYKLRLAKESNEKNEAYVSTHTQIAYMAYIYGMASGAGEVVEFLEGNSLIEESDIFVVKDLFISRPLSELGRILPKIGE